MINMNGRVIPASGTTFQASSNAVPKNYIEARDAMVVERMKKYIEPIPGLPEYGEISAVIHQSKIMNVEINHKVR